jgi:hypothetical protein
MQCRFSRQVATDTIASKVRSFLATTAEKLTNIFFKKGKTEAKNLRNFGSHEKVGRFAAKRNFGG